MGNENDPGSQAYHQQRPIHRRSFNGCAGVRSSD
jgi:hypothetical protein